MRTGSKITFLQHLPLVSELRKMAKNISKGHETAFAQILLKLYSFVPVKIIILLFSTCALSEDSAGDCEIYFCFGACTVCVLTHADLEKKIIILYKLQKANFLLSVSKINVETVWMFFILYLNRSHCFHQRGSVVS